jgi:hypothetical protein
MQEKEKHVVQMLFLKEVEVEAYDTIQAEIEAYKGLKPAERKALIAFRAYEPQVDPPKKWGYLQEKLYAPDFNWLNDNLD